ncbi:EAL domain-containing protein [Achromobacter insolitus]|uniref:EAL domain-containing protein n=1 Tax=Achromobacter insolitus TaxID=217204 RepID=UPI0009ED0327|nr:EAL domain-containing protein [Achromobacter insolitus]
MMTLLPALQPIVYGLTSEILAYEALARWRRGEQIVGPMDLPTAPSWNHVDIEMLSAILADADTVADVAPRLFINVSAGTIADPECLSSWISHLAKVARRATFAIVIEITEGIRDDKLQEAWPQLKRLGVKLALDDFGGGRSSRARLLRYDWDYCKFEGHTVREPEIQEAIRYCHNNGILPIVERVEHQQSSEEFAGMGLHWQQGFLHGRPELVAELRQAKGERSQGALAVLQHG